MISLQNYEEYFVRFIDGELSPGEVTALKSFLQANPDLNRELELFRQMVLPAAEPVAFPGKEFLKKGITEANSEEYFIRSIEGDLSAREQSELNDFLRFHPEFQKTLGYFQSTKLSPDTSIVFPDKRSLKKSTGRVRPIGIRFILTTAAAAVLVAVLLMKGVNWNQETLTNQVAQQQTPNEISEGTATTSGDQNAGGEISGQNSIASNDVKDGSSTASPETKKTEASSQQSAPLLADASHEDSETAASVQETQLEFAELTPIGTGKAQPIYYRAKPKKALYKDIPAPTTASAASTTNTSPIGVFASGLGAELLKLSGRGDYLPQSATTSERDKGPLALNLEGERFGFNTTLFKKRAEKNSSSN